MDIGQRIVTQTPLTELWDSNGTLDAHRIEPVGEAEIVRLLGDGSAFVVADAGLPLRWIAADDRFAFWKGEVKHRLVAPDNPRIQLDNYRGGYCYVATMWTCASMGSVVVLEKHH
ncbi:MAG: hypothetical protein ACI4XG_21455 [Bradyrhizobium sp.]